MQEKRKFVRIEWPVVVHYKTLVEPFTKDQIISKNVSETGVLFTVYERLAKGTRLDMQIQTPFDSLPIFAKGEVVWIKEFEEHRKIFEAGVNFIELNPEDRKRLKLYIDNEIRQRKSASD
ncbi:MAG: PilZ domain-containing protein [Candidatus Omnitrophica bacterium]|nr:PilZ domain-containing protein [Candidatus Omnitrophota bacterium]MBU4590204.1 PilZ domain-containing protein [Candidatus Omnitrophota bacterium]